MHLHRARWTTESAGEETNTQMSASVPRSTSMHLHHSCLPTEPVAEETNTQVSASVPNVQNLPAAEETNIQ